eukprot:CAMPEP_0117736288 /NCGR_PEP_ID=MMETSP0947-20121206/1832_1 /TAXON_ID=44440 /ORGANISM="Chattonella subsalsa, Strain CCMP2191" /LENGTH=899 /DNA_ID=CAMNT_0005551533 /DNA_START=287 /DNA_END=2986 /DNA_ORIENTATION=+
METNSKILVLGSSASEEKLLNEIENEEVCNDILTDIPQHTPTGQGDSEEKYSDWKRAPGRFTHYWSISKKLHLRKERSDRLTDDEFRKRNGYNWDYCMIFPVKSKDKDEEDQMQQQQEGGGGLEIDMEGVSKLCHFCVTQLEEAGMETMLFFNSKKDQIFCKIRVPLWRLKDFAAAIDWKMPLNRPNLKKAIETGDEEHNIKPIQINEEGKLSRYAAWDYIYAKYRKNDSLQQLYELEKDNYYRRDVDDEVKHGFRNSLRLCLIMEMIEAREEDGGAELSPRLMLFEDQITGFFPLHNFIVKDRLAERISWKQPPWRLPRWKIKGYFGEQIGMYFEFIIHYSTWLLMPGTLGAVVHILYYWYFRKEAQSIYCLAGYSFFIAIWASVMLTWWKRRQSILKLQWGTKGIEQKQQDRPEFTGDAIDSPVDGTTMIYFPISKKRLLMSQSALVIISLAGIVCACTAGVIYLRSWLTQDGSTLGAKYGSWVASLVNGIQINAMNALYRAIAVILTDRENHRTDIMYQDALIAKIFVCQFVNSYANFYYIAFMMKLLPEERLEMLQSNLAIIFLTQLVIANIADVTLPFLQHKKNMQFVISDTVREKIQESEDPAKTSAEYEFTLDRFDEIMGTLNEYVDLSIQFGYLTLFVAVFPLAPLAAFASNYLKVHATLWRLLNMTQRPVPIAVEDIGHSENVFNILVVIAVVTNCGLICFVMSKDIYFEEYGETTKVWVFILLQYAMFTLLYGIPHLLPDEPLEVKLQFERTKFLVSKVVDKIPDRTHYDVKSLMAKRKNKAINFQVFESEEKMRQAASNLVDQMEDALRNVKDGIEEAGDALVDGFAEAGEDLKEVGEKMIDAIRLSNISNISNRSSGKKRKKKGIFPDLKSLPKLSSKKEQHGEDRV